MVHIVKRMRKLRELLWIRIGPGALILPKEVTKISMEFNARLAGGHRGPRKFWREMLPRIKYHNPAIPIQISRHSDPAGPSFLHVYTSQGTTTAQPTPTSTGTPPSGTPNAQTTLVPDTSTPTYSIETKFVGESDILDQLVAKTGARVLKATQEELDEQAEIEDFKVRAEKDRVEVREKLLKERREQELLRLARGEATAAA